MKQETGSETSEGTRSGPITTTLTRETPLHLRLTIEPKYFCEAEDMDVSSVGTYWIGRDPEKGARAASDSASASGSAPSSQLRDKTNTPVFYWPINDPTNKLSRAHCSLEVSEVGLSLLCEFVV